MPENFVTELALLRRICELVAEGMEFRAYMTEEGWYLEVGSFVNTADLTPPW